MSRVRVALLPLALLGCAGALQDPDRFDYLFEDAGTTQPGDGGYVAVVDAGRPMDAGMSGESDAGCDPVVNLFPTTCATAACHSAATPQSGLDLQSPGLPARLVGKTASTSPGLLIDPTTPGSSVLYLQVTAHPPDGFRMPIGTAALSSEQEQCLLMWVEAAVAH